MAANFIETPRYRINLDQILFVEVDSESRITVYFTHGTETFRGDDAIAILEATTEDCSVVGDIVFEDEDMVRLDL